MGRAAWGALGLAVGLLVLPGAPAAAQGVRVLVDGQAVAFDQPPVVMAGRVLVPLRGVFERLDATVQWDPFRNTVTAVRDGTQVQLTIGQRMAYVNGRPIRLDVPPLIVGGRTLVPLRFVTEAMGARVDYDAAANTVVVHSPVAVIPAPVPPAPAPPVVTPAQPTTLEGVVFRVDAASWRLLVQRATTIQTIEVGLDTAISRIDVGTGRARAIGLDDLRPGDFVRVTLDAAGRALAIRVSVRDVAGRIDAVSTRVIVLSDGQTFQFADGARVFIGGQEVPRERLRPGMEVTLRLNPQTNQIVTVLVESGGAQRGAEPARIASFTHDAARPLRAGATLTVTLRGTPGGTAVFDIFGVATGVPMREISSGVYRGAYTVRGDDNVANAVVIGRLRASGTEAPLVQAGTPITLDAVPPRILQRLPQANHTVANARPNIVLSVTDEGSGLDPAASRLVVNGQNVTGRATFTDTVVTYVPPAPLSGAVEVRIVLADRAGNVRRDRYTFTIAGTEAGGVIRSVTASATVLRAGERLTVTATGEPGGQATFRIDGVTAEVPMTEVPNQPGVYVGSVVVEPREPVANARLVVTLSRAGRTVSAEASARLTLLAADRVPPPVITQPAAGAQIGAPIVVSGRAAPGQRVVVRVDYQTTVAVVRLGGTFGEVATAADATGNWSVTIARTIRLPSAEVTIVAVAVDALGRRSEPAIVRAVLAGP